MVFRWLMLDKILVPHKRKTRQNNSGFSLVELIIVISIMGVLLGVIAPAFIRYVQKSRIVKDEQNLDIVRQTIETMLSNEDFYDDLTNASIIILEDGSVSIENTKLSADEVERVTKEFTDILNNTKVVMSSYRYSDKKITINIIDGIISEPKIE